MKKCTPLHCGAKHIWKSKLQQKLMFGPLLDVELLKKCMPLWREAHLEVEMSKMYEKVHSAVARTYLDVHM